MGDIGQPPALVGLAEIENRAVLEGLLRHTPLHRMRYQIVHEESPDRRGNRRGAALRPRPVSVPGPRSGTGRSIWTERPSHPRYFVRSGRDWLRHRVRLHQPLALALRRSGRQRSPTATRRRRATGSSARPTTGVPRRAGHHHRRLQRRTHRGKYTYARRSKRYRFTPDQHQPVRMRGHAQVPGGVEHL